MPRTRCARSHPLVPPTPPAAPPSEQQLDARRRRQQRRDQRMQQRQWEYDNPDSGLTMLDDAEEADDEDGEGDSIVHPCDVASVAELLTDLGRWVEFCQMGQCGTPALMSAHQQPLESLSPPVGAGASDAAGAVVSAAGGGRVAASGSVHWTDLGPCMRQWAQRPAYGRKMIANAKHLLEFAVDQGLVSTATLLVDRCADVCGAVLRAGWVLCCWLGARLRLPAGALVVCWSEECNRRARREPGHTSLGRAG